jgi:hypothetical protein
MGVGWTHPRKLWLYFNYPYSLAWLLATIGGFLAIAFWDASWLGDLIVALALWRVAEILILHVKMLLDRTHQLILAAERNLVFLAIDSLAVITAVAAMLMQARPTNALSTWVDSLSTVTLNGRPSDYAGGWANAATVVGTFAGLILLGAGLAVLVGLIQEKFRISGDDEYTGPTRIEKPTRDRILGTPQV